jgi:hypothetical protein
MQLDRRNVLRLAGAAGALAAGSRLALAMDYPARPVQLIVPATAGSGADVTARVIGMSELAPPTSFFFPWPTCLSPIASLPLPTPAATFGFVQD